MLRKVCKTAFYGWKLGALVMLGNLLIQGGAVYLMNIFTQPFAQLYGWTRGEITTALGLGSFCGMVAAPLLASLAMRLSLRRIFFAGSLLGSASLFCLGRFENYWLFTLDLCLLWVASQACGGVIGNALMSNWFMKHRGKAFGLANFGTSISGAILPFAAMLLIKFVSVQTATAILGGVAFVLLVPAAWLMVRDAPADMGLEPDGAPHPSPEAAAAEANHVPPTIRELLRDPLTYRIAIAFTLAILAAAGTVSQLKPRFSDLGFGDFAATIFMCVTAAFVASGKYIWGWICDKLTPLRTAKFLFLFNCAAFTLAFLPPNIYTVSLFSVVCGIGVGAPWTVLPAVVAEVFGRKNFIAAYRVISFFLFFKSLGFIFMGQSYELTGSYDAAFAIFCAICLLCFFLTPKPGTKYRKAEKRPAL